MKPEELPLIGSNVYGVRIYDKHICHGKLVSIHVEKEVLKFVVLTKNDIKVSCDFVGLTTLQVETFIIEYYTMVYRKLISLVQDYGKHNPIK